MSTAKGGKPIAVVCPEKNAGRYSGCEPPIAVPLLAVLPNYCVNLTRNGVAVAGLHFILAPAIHAAAGRLHS